MTGRAAIRATLLAAALAALASTPPQPASAQERRLIHDPPASLPPSVPWECVVRAARAADWEQIELLYRRLGESAYTLVPLRDDRGAFRATVPAEAIRPPGLQYFLSARSAAGEFVTLPSEAPRERPFRVSVAGAATGILVLSPSEGEITETATPDIAVLFDPPLADPSRATFFLDGEEKTSACERTIDFLIFTTPAPLAPGDHEATVAVFPDSGATASLTWRFSVLASAPGGSRGRASAGGILVSGRWEAGWAVADAEGEPAPFVLPYDETSDATYYATLDAVRGQSSLHADAARDPIYDDEIRASARFERPGLRLEGGDLYPFLSELSVAWQSGKGGFASVERGRASASLFGMRTLRSDLFEGFGTYSQYLYGAQTSARFGENRVALTVTYGHDREASIPDSTRFSPPLVNRVATLLASRRLARRASLSVEVAHGSTSERGTETANAVRAVLALGEPGKNEVKLEYHDYGRGFLTIGSPTIDSGEHGVVIDASGRLPLRVRGSGRAEIYGDRDIFQPLAGGTPILQLTGRIDREFPIRSARLSAYVFGRFYRVPFESVPYESRYATLGAFAQAGRASLSGSATRARTETAGIDTSLASGDDGGSGSSGGDGDSMPIAIDRDWTLAATAAYSSLFGWLTPRLGLRWTGAERASSADEDRWTATAEANVTFWRTTLSAEYQRISESSEGSEPSDLIEHVVAVTLGRPF